MFRLNASGQMLAKAYDFKLIPDNLLSIMHAGVKKVTNSPW